jgi:hypothetical protein
MDGTHDFIPSRVAGQQFFVSFLPPDQLPCGIPNPEDKLFLIKDLTCCSAPQMWSKLLTECIQKEADLS